ncbi:hypothetical protein JG688_00015765 [Phytophthora aleatoria]|uniref:Uncharacterized protein n=1 Tax=Phytophthora aleatoria TaxID=2496075 RepID=A0A8J5ISQ5_9STRA|nr:hypothetical protein JG688_00015765 [Phytophthora aleatoria]
MVMRVVVISAIALLGMAHPTAATQSLPAQSLTGASPVKLHVNFKRKSMKLHGQSEFDIYATPVVSTNGPSVHYNSLATFQDADFKFTYTLLDGSAYLTTTDAFDVETVRCLPPNTLPFDEILPALNSATPIPSASTGGKSIECASGNLFKTTFSGDHYAICALGEAGFMVYSSDLDISVEYLDSPVSISKPVLTDTSAACEIGQKLTSLTPTALALATGSKIPSSHSRMLIEEAHMTMEATSCETCMSTPRPCIFLHGLGNPNEEAELQDTPELTNR